MILHSLEVQNFRVLREVRLTFGRGLNVLFGPNDLGKSSIVEALRTAFLLPVTSTQNRDFLPWGTDHVPRVVVVFEVNDTVWKLTKEFGPGSRGSACLERVGESGALLPEAQGRAVEGKVRELLAWGIPIPGGKGAPRGLPQSYLTMALLGHQDQVTAILDASLEDDGVDTGLCFVTNALGVLGQDPLVGQLVQRLEERVAMVFTPAGKVKANGPLAERTREITDQQQRLASLSELLQKSEEIERKVQLLTEQKDRASDECDRLQKHLELLRTARRATDELENVRAHDRALTEARLALAVVEAEAEGKEASHEQADAALRKMDDELRAARERLAKASGTRDEVLKNTQNARAARQAQLIARRDTAARREQSAQEVLHARQLAESRARGLAQVDEAYQRALLAKRHAQDLAEFAGLVVQCTQANQAIEAWKASQKERDDMAATLSAVGAALKKTEIALEEAEGIVVTKKDALAMAGRAAADRHLCREGLRSSLIRAESAEQEALQASAQAKAAIASVERLAGAESSLAELDANEHELEAKLAGNAAEKEACETARGTSKPLPIRPALVVGLLGATVMAALGLALKLQGLVVAAASIGCAVVAAVLTTLILRSRQLHESIQVSRCRADDLLKVRQGILEERNQVLVKRGVAQIRVDSARSERDQAIERIPDPHAALQRARLRLQESRSEKEKIGKELASFDSHQPEDGVVTAAEVEAAERAVLLMKNKVKETRGLRDEAHQRLAEAQVRVEVSKPSAASVDLAAMQDRLKGARMKVGDQPAPLPEDAQTQFQAASQAAVELETALQLAKGRLSDAQSRFDGLAATLEQPPDQVLTDASKEREDVEAALQCLEESLSAQTLAAENQFREAEVEVTRLEGELTVARNRTEDAMRALEESQTKRLEDQKRVDSLLQFAPSTTVPAAEATFEVARNELECCSPGSGFSAEDLAEGESLLEQRRAELQRTESALHSARGQLELVGGTVVREQRDQESEALEGLRMAADDLELECKATKRLLDVLKAAEAKHSAHLGRSLAKPVTEMLLDLAGHRYTQVVLDPTLRVRNIAAKGADRELASLSVGTRDQLATLVRLTLAAHLRSVLVLDDQLAQSDQKHLDWFRNRLHASVREHNHQIIVITCRPLDYVRKEDMPGPSSCGRLETECGLTVIDLEQATLSLTD